ncbi:glutathione S-transferase family protein [Aliiroseovarius sp.]|uniref:glutathione S-transferase family protein n=1 Tax=Aliiroseovarius sp. TaxID=1872442 RepID=UPI00261C3D16|nr:glutathione S-transferase family protein [Aliiroseovarius sp.]
MYRLHYAPDNASLIIRLVLEEMDLPYRTVLVDRSVTAQHSAAYLRINPMGMIPALETPDGPMFETAAILLWLADKYGLMAPLPGTPERAPFLSWLVAISTGLQMELRQLSYPERYAGDDTESHAAKVRARLIRMLDRLEALAGDGHGWFAGDRMTVLDIYVTVLLRWHGLYPRGGTDWFVLGTWPRLQALCAAVERRPSMQSAIEAEGLGPSPLTAPRYATPKEGTAL